MRRTRIIGSAVILMLFYALPVYLMGYLVAQRTCYGKCDQHPFSWWWVLLGLPVVTAVAAALFSLPKSTDAAARRLLVTAAFLTILVVIIVLTHHGAVRSLEGR